MVYEDKISKRKYEEILKTFESQVGWLLQKMALKLSALNTSSWATFQYLLRTENSEYMGVLFSLLGNLGTSGSWKRDNS